jgi:hypothetical protein
MNVETVIWNLNYLRHYLQTPMLANYEEKDSSILKLQNGSIPNPVHSMVILFKSLEKILYALHFSSSKKCKKFKPPSVHSISNTNHPKIITETDSIFLSSQSLKFSGDREYYHF